MELRELSQNLPKVQQGQSQPHLGYNKKIQNYVFNLQEVMGQGNFSKVYKAANVTNNQIVAIKVIEMLKMKAPTLHNLLESEIEILGAIKHPNILNCFEVFTSVNNCYIITEMCDTDLEGFLKKTGSLEQPDARKIIYDIFSGLKYLAEQKIVHRDLKIANIFLKNGIAKVADFGFAKRMAQNFRDVSIGTPIYMAPEGLIEHIYGPKTDVWAFGVVIYEILHGCTPLSFCQTESELRMNITMPLPPQKLKHSIPQDLRQLILRCLQVDWRKRPTIHEMLKSTYIQGLFREFSKSSDTHVNNENVCLDYPPMQIGSLTNCPNSPKSQVNPFGTHLPAKVSAFRRTSIDLEQQMIQMESGITNCSTVSKANHKPTTSDRMPSSGLFSNNETSSSSETILSRISFQEALQMLHYCRLLYKTRQLIILEPSLKNSVIVDFYGNFVMQLINELKGKLKKQNLLIETPSASEAKLRGVVNEYCAKYSSEIIPNSHLRLDHNKIQSVSLNTLRQLDCIYSSAGLNKDQMVASIYINYVYDVDRVVESCAQRQSYSPLLTEVNVEEFLKIKYESFDETYYLPIRARLQEISCQ